jgi:hypothetical protein
MPREADKNLVLVVPRLDSLAHRQPRRRGPISGNPKMLMRHVGDLKGLRKLVPKTPLRRPRCAVHFQQPILISPSGK